MANDLSSLRKTYEELKGLGLSLDIQRGQPADENFALSHGMLTCVGPEDTVSPSGLGLCNYPGGLAGIAEARELFAEVLGIEADETLVGNNSSLKLLSDTLMWALLRGLREGEAPWNTEPRKMIVTVPGYDRHFTLLESLGFEMPVVPMTAEGPDLDAVEALALDPAVYGMVFVPTYSNPTGDTISPANVARLAAMPTANPAFTILADDAYRIHHLSEDRHEPSNLLRACEAAGNPNRVVLLGSTSKVTFAGAGLGFLGTSRANLKRLTQLMGSEYIGPNKLEQYRHVKFLRAYPNGLEGLMADHAKMLRPKFDAVARVLERELGDTGLARWTDPKGGYFVSLDTTRPVAKRVVALASEAGVTLTPAGASYPHRLDPGDSNLRIAPTRPPVEEVETGMGALALCVKLASAEFDAGG
jgi:DNA-binding transcriptional MocR family regulator